MYYPLKAMTTGSVYDISPEEYRRYLLSREGELEYLALMEENIEEKNLRMDVNLPNFNLVLDKASEYIFNRTLTNVGCPKCTYKVEIWLHGKKYTSRLGEEVDEAFPKYINISVEQNVLNFCNFEERKYFKVIVRDQLVLAHVTLICRE
ncbi:hypothetical protein ERO13_A13G222113v2 [Gossypium hirsutum]|nr:hypothetical protein ERO13_A13G222113v2 [Gossypium hirsutum]